MRFQKGQTIVELAMVLPFFFLIFFGILEFGLAFGDYLLLNKYASDLARIEANMSSSSTYSNMSATYTDYKTDTINAKLHVYKLDGNWTPTFTTQTTSDTDTSYVEIEIKAKPDNSKSALVTYVDNFLTKYYNKSPNFSALSFDIVYTMHWLGKSSS